MPDGYQQDQGPDLQATAAPAPPPCVPVTLDMDADVLGWLQEQPLWRHEINALLRAYMEVNLIRKTAFEEAAADSSRGNFKMPDGNQDVSAPGPLNPRHPRSRSTSPARRNPAGGMARAIAFVRTCPARPWC